MFLLPHSAFLIIHLLKAFIFGKLLHKFSSKCFFHTLFFSCSLSFQTQLEIFSLLKFLLNSFTFFNFSSLSLNRSFFTFLEVKVISKVFQEFLLCTSLNFFGFKSFENLITGISSSIFSRLDLVLSLLLLFSVTADHFVFLSLHFFKSTLLSSFFLNTQNHISLSLLHF